MKNKNKKSLKEKAKTTEQIIKYRHKSIIKKYFSVSEGDKGLKKYKKALKENSEKRWIPLEEFKQFIKQLKEDNEFWKFKRLAYKEGFEEETVESLDFGALVGLCCMYFYDKINKLSGFENE
ncbi:MAG: hypothetical protein ACOC56_06305 [Atribacterota bacterium]